MDSQRDHLELHQMCGIHRQPEKTSSRIRQLLSQCCAMCVPNLLMITCGLSLGFATVLIPELYKKDAEIVVTLGELTWISGMNYFANPVGSLISGSLTKSLGRRWMLVISAVQFLIAWLLFHWWAADAWTVMLGFALLGFASGMSDPSSQIYATEISQVKLRGTMATSLMVTALLGTFLQVLINDYVHWRSLALISAVFPTVALVGTFFIPESPHWLINKNRLADAEESLRWLRGWTDSISIQSEYDILLQSALPSSKTTSASRPSTSWTKLYLRREFLLPFALVLFCFFVSAFNGSVSVLTFSVLVFEKLESPIDEYTATLFLTVVQLVASVLLMLLINRTGKRKPTLVSLLGTGLSMLAISVYVLMKDLKVIQKESSHSWLPMTLMLVSVFISCLGIRCTPWFFAGEMFPLEVRGVAVGLLISLGNVFAALASKSFLYQLDSFTLPGTFLFFALLNLFGFVVLCWTLPETENKTFAEIEKHFTKKDNNGGFDMQTSEFNSHWTPDHDVVSSM